MANDLRPGELTEGEMPHRAGCRAVLTGLPALLLLQALAGCSNSDPDWPAYVPATPRTGDPPPAEQWPAHGYFMGTVDIAGEKLDAEAILTVDGLLRLHVLGSANPWGDPAGALQFAGRVDIDNDLISGSGIVLGEACADPESNSFCGASGHGDGQLRLSLSKQRLTGDLEVTTGEGPQSWNVDMDRALAGSPGASYRDPPNAHYVAGLYRELLAEFAAGGDVIISVDGTGQLFFQSADTGCTGGGAITLHLDGAFGVYDVRLMIRNCVAEHGYLNGDFEGLAVQGYDWPWDYGAYWLRMWLSSVPGTASPTALTMWSMPQ